MKSWNLSATQSTACLYEFRRFPTEPPKRVGTNHLKLFMRQGIVERDAIFFNGAERELPNPPWDIAFTIDRNVYRGRASCPFPFRKYVPTRKCRKRPIAVNSNRPLSCE